MKNIITIVVVVAMFAIVGGTSASAQVPMSEKKAPIGMSVGLKSNHLWRGLEVSDAAAFTGDLHISTWDESLKFGLWSGAALNGVWKEFNYYASYSIGGFNVAVWDIYNFSPGAAYNNREFFNYNARETGHFVDLSLSYRCPDPFPLGISAAVVVFGRDRGDINDKQRYSTYVTLDYPILRSDLINLDIACSGAFALQEANDANGVKVNNHFYGSSPGIVNVSLTASRALNIGNYNLPVSLLCMWNPEANYANMQLAVTLLQF